MGLEMFNEQDKTANAMAHSHVSRRHNLYLYQGA